MSTFALGASLKVTVQPVRSYFHVPCCLSWKCQQDVIFSRCSEDIEAHPRCRMERGLGRLFFFPCRPWLELKCWEMRNASLADTAVTGEYSDPCCQPGTACYWGHQWRGGTGLGYGSLTATWDNIFTTPPASPHPPGTRYYTKPKTRPTIKEVPQQDVASLHLNSYRESLWLSRRQCASQGSAVWIRSTN